MAEGMAAMTRLTALDRPISYSLEGKGKKSMMLN
jgi:hypothetical protein